MKSVSLALGSILLLISVGCTAYGATGATQTPTISATAFTLATVTDFSVPFASSESGALIARGFDGYAEFGRLRMGCQVQILKTTDRAAQIKVMSCPKGDDKTPPIGLSGWVAKSALSL